jgi:hypothetical protein
VDGVRWEGHRLTEVGGPISEAWWLTVGPVLLERKRLLNRDGGVTFDEARFSASLPKVLYGTNAAVELGDPGEVMAALDQVDRSLADVAALPPARDADVRRVDVTADVQLDGEDMVGTALARLAAVRLRGRYPIRGEHLSVSWRRKSGAITRKAYSKYLESGDDIARGRLRVEAGILGQPLVRRLLREHGRVSVGVLAESEGIEMRDKVGGALSAFVAPYVKEVEELDLYTAFQRFRARNRSGTSMTMVGYALMVQHFGWEFLEGQITRQGLWKVRKRFEEAGVDPMELEWEPGQKEKYLVEAAKDAGMQPELFIGDEDADSE